MGFVDNPMLALLHACILALSLAPLTLEQPASTAIIVTAAPDTDGASGRALKRTAPLVGGCEEISTRPTVPPRMHVARHLLRRHPVTALLLKTHRSSEQPAAGGHIKFQHASNAPPHSS